MRLVREREREKKNQEKDCKNIFDRRRNRNLFLRSAAAAEVGIKYGHLLAGI